MEERKGWFDLELFEINSDFEPDLSQKASKRFKRDIKNIISWLYQGYIIILSFPDQMHGPKWTVNCSVESEGPKSIKLDI